MKIISTFIDIHESQANAAKVLGLKDRQVLHNWKARGRIPSKYWPLIVKNSHGKISLEDFYEGTA